MQIRNWRTVLGAAELDPAVNIRIAALTDNTEFNLYVTEILPGLSVGAHSHNEGIEVYEILQGMGVLHTLKITNENTKAPELIQHTTVKAGDFFEIPARVIHQLENNGNTPLILIFGCPPAHLSTDRVLAQDLLTQE